MAKIKHTSYRLPDETKKKLAQLAELDGLTSTAVINKLILAEYRARKKEIEEFLNNTENESKTTK